MDGRLPSNLGRGTLPRGRSTFLTRTATDNAAQLLRRSSLPTPPRELRRDPIAQSDGTATSHDVGEPASESIVAQGSPSLADSQNVTGQGQGYGFRDSSTHGVRKRAKNGKVAPQESTTQGLGNVDRRDEKPRLPKVGSMPRPVGGTEKLDTFSGVFVPTSLNVLSILMFIRFGFILGQAGLLGMLGMLVAAYVINLVTTMSISAIASNGTVRGGGAYFLISRSLGPEFGGSIGIVFYLGFVFNTGLNAVGLVDCLIEDFGSLSGNWTTFLPEGRWWEYLWSTIVLLCCTGICLAGSAVFARASNGLLLVLLIATFSIPVSSLVLKPFASTSKQLVEFTGWSLHTLKQNALPRLTKGAAGSQMGTKETFSDLFGILFPATGGIFAGASMSGDLKNPSKSIPKGTLYGLGLTFFAYAVVVLSMAASISRRSFYQNVNIVQDTNLSAILILLGECATTLFSVLMGVIGPAKLLQAIARDSILPGLRIFGQGTSRGDEPVFAILLTFVVTQLTMLFDINQIASFITMTYLMTFFVTNLACFLLRIASAPNFRPSFQYFNSYTAGVGAILSVVSMFFVDGFYATGCIGILVILFLIIHFTTPPKSWGDVSQSLIYHQVRKYLLRLRTEHVKFWRPQILLFVNDPRRGYKLIQFCNSLKKGSLYILGHVIVTNNFGASVPEARRQQAAWTKYIDFSMIKAFVNVAISPSVEYGTRNIVLSAGLGGMRPNIVVMGFYNLQQFRQEQPLVDVPSPPPERRSGTHRVKKSRSRSQIQGELPTDSCIIETRMDVQSYVMILEDLILKLQTNFAVAVGFSELELPDSEAGNTKKYIDLWPIQMSAEIPKDEHSQQNIQTTNFDTYTLILQLGCILHTVPSWRKAYHLRVAVFVEYESDVEEERIRVTSLLENLRIQAEVLVFWLAAGDIKSYEVIVNGANLQDGEVQGEIEKVLEDEEWWQGIRKLRGMTVSEDASAADELVSLNNLGWGGSPLPRTGTCNSQLDLRHFLERGGRRRSFGNVTSFGISPGMRTHRLDDDLLSRHASYASRSEDSELDDDSIVSDSMEESFEPEDGEDSLFESENLPGNLQQTGMDSPTPGIVSASKKSSRASSKSKQSKASSRKSQHLDESKRDSADPAHESKDISGPSTLSSPSSHPQSTSRDGLHQQLQSDVAGNSPEPLTSSPKAAIQTVSLDGAGPSIMFADSPHPRHQQEPQSRSIYTRKTSTSPEDPSSSSSTTTPNPAAAASVPLSFNDLPSRAQHLILNELMSLHTEDTAVVFTTLPPPREGTYKDEADSLRYVSDLEVLCQGLPPCLMVHSNSMTVTVNL